MGCIGTGKGRVGRATAMMKASVTAVIAVVVISAAACTPPDGGGGGGGTPTTGRFNAIPRDPGPCGPDQPVAPSDYFARADVTNLPVRANSADWTGRLAAWDVVRRGSSVGGNLSIFWDNAPAAPSAFGQYAYPVNFVGQQWPMQHWAIQGMLAGQTPFPPAPFFTPVDGVTYPQAGDYPVMQNGATTAWHLGSPDLWGGLDRIVLFRGSDSCNTYEITGMQLSGLGNPVTGPADHATSGVIWDAQFHPRSAFSPSNWYWSPNGVGAAAIPMTPMVLRVDEVAAKVGTGQPLDHALYWAASTPTTGSPDNCSHFVWPARHADCGHVPSPDPTMPAEGAWLRLAADFPESGYSPQMQVIIRTLKTRGMVFADGGSNGIFAEPGGCQAVGGPAVDPGTDIAHCWTTDTLAQLTAKPIPLSAFDVVDPTAMRLDQALDPDPNASTNGPDPNTDSDYQNLWRCKAPYCA
ncbi:MAG: hypothetical protein JST64_03455 [Actinobacteria bacterium]|nr:hypothetical protein [Actinomycetota bacterium]